MVAPSINTTAENASRTKELDIVGKLPSPWQDAAGALIEKSFQQTPVGDIFGRSGIRTPGGSDERGFIERFFDLQDLRNNGEQKLSAHELNELYPNVETQFRDGETREAAAEIARRSYERQYLDSRIARGNLGTATSLGLSALAFMSDPISLSLSILPPVRALGAAVTARFGVVAGGVSEAVAVNAVEEAAFYSTSQSELADITAADSLRNIAFGAAGLGALHFGARSIGKAIRSLPGLSKHLMSNSVSSVLAGKKPKIDAITRAATQELSGSADNVGHRFEKLGADDLSTRPLYHGSNSVQENIKSISGERTSNELINLGDGGVSFSDHALIENAKAGNSTVDQQGLLREVRLSKGLNIIDLDEQISPLVLVRAKEVVSQMKKKMKKNDFLRMTNGTGRALYDEADKLIKQDKLPADSINKINKALEEGGFDGVRTEVGGDFNGAKIQRHNTVKLFGSGTKKSGALKYSQQRTFTANDQLLQKADSQQISDSIKNNLSDDNDMAIDIREVRQNQILAKEFDQEIAVKQEEITRSIAELDGLKKKGLLDAEDLAELEVTKALKKKADDDAIITRNAIICLNRQ